MPSLYVVATPIGNLEDITFRAVRVLSEVDLIAAEDTRKTKILLDRYKIEKPLTSYHKFNIKQKTDYLVEQIKQGKNIAIVTDAGMPAISDPGYELICSAVDAGIQVITIPGPSAMTSALAVSGLNADKFIFLGFLPRKPGKQRKIFNEYASFSGTIIIYESPFRVLKTLKEIHKTLGDRRVVVARELTKKFEELIRGPIYDIILELERRTLKGEITLLVEGLPAYGGQR